MSGALGFPRHLPLLLPAACQDSVSRLSATSRCAAALSPPCMKADWVVWAVFPRPLAVGKSTSTCEKRLLASSMSGVIGFPRHLPFPLPAACQDMPSRFLSVSRMLIIWLRVTSPEYPCIMNAVWFVPFAPDLAACVARGSWFPGPAAGFPWGTCEKISLTAGGDTPIDATMYSIPFSVTQLVCVLLGFTCH